MLASRIGLLALALMVSLPFLMPKHTTPIPSFHGEWLAAAFGLAASSALLGARRLPLPGAALLALSLGGIALAQTVFGPAPVPQLSDLFALYLFWAALLACTGSHLASVLGQARLARTLAGGILLGSILAALASLIQYWRPGSVGWIGFLPGQGGTIGQANHFASYLWLGLASALYLRNTAVLPNRVYWIAITLLTATAVLVGQRSSFMYLATLVGIAAWLARGTTTAALAEGRRRALGIALLFILLQPLPWLLPSVAEPETRPPPAMRILQQISGPSARVQLWNLGAAGIKAAPFIGNGIGSYPGLALVFADTLPASENPGPAEHAHNIVVALGAELGVPAVLLFLLGTGIWLWRLPRRAAPAETAWAAAVLAFIGLHSMIEYPLWYAYFLGLAAVVAGAFGVHRAVGRRLAPVALTLGLLAWGSLALTELHRDYKNLELSIALGSRPTFMPQATAALLQIPHTSLLAPWVNTTACSSLDPLRVSLVDGLTVCQIGLAFAPNVVTGVNMAVLQWRAGNAAGGQDLLHRMKSALENRLPGGVAAQLAPLVAREPGLLVLTETRDR